MGGCEQTPDAIYNTELYSCATRNQALLLLVDDLLKRSVPIFGESTLDRSLLTKYEAEGKAATHWQLVRVCTCKHRPLDPASHKGWRIEGLAGRGTD